jgi:hypothetical protein
LNQAHEHHIIKNQQDFAQLHPNFAWLPENVVKESFKNTTQYARMPMSTVLKKHYKSPFPALKMSTAMKKRLPPTLCTPMSLQLTLV